MVFSLDYSMLFEQHTECHCWSLPSCVRAFRWRGGWVV